MLSLTGSLLSDPTNPPDPSTLPIPNSIAQRANSPTPEPVMYLPPSARPAKKTKSTPALPIPDAAAAATAAAAAPAPAPASAQRPLPAATNILKEEIDEAFLSPRELKQKRKEDERRKRDARKERKEANELEGTVAAGGRVAVAMSGVEEEVQVKHGGVGGEGGGVAIVPGAVGDKKRKNEDGAEGKRKKKKNQG